MASGRFHRILYSLMHRSIVPSCSGQTCFVVVGVTGRCVLQVSDSLIPVQMPDAHSIHVSLSISPLATGVMGNGVIARLLENQRIWSRMAGRLSDESCAVEQIAGL